MNRSILALSVALVLGAVSSPFLQAAGPSPIGTGLKSGITLGALNDPSKVIKTQPYLIDYTTDLKSQVYDVYIAIL